jgi:hypothetical protein
VPLLFVRSDGGQFTDTDYRNWRRRRFHDAAGAAGLLEWDKEAKRWVGDYFASLTETPQRYLPGIHDLPIGFPVVTS